MKAIIIIITFTIFSSLTSASAGGGGGHGGGGPKTRTARAIGSADDKATDGSPHAALALKTHEANPSLS